MSNQNKGRITRTAVGLNANYPKAYVRNGDYEDVVIVADAAEVAAVDPGGFFIEPVAAGWGTGNNKVLTGSDGTQSFVIVFPEAAPTTTVGAT